MPSTLVAIPIQFGQWDFSLTVFCPGMADLMSRRKWPGVPFTVAFSENSLPLNLVAVSSFQFFVNKRQHNMMFKSKGSGAGLPGFQCWLCHLLEVTSSYFFVL